MLQEVLSSQAPTAVYVCVQVPPKFYRYNASVVWNPPVNTPISWVPGPYSMAKVSTK